MPLYNTRIKPCYPGRGAEIRTRAKSSQKTRATATLHPVSKFSPLCYTPLKYYDILFVCPWSILLKNVVN